MHASWYVPGRVQLQWACAHVADVLSDVFRVASAFQRMGCTRDEIADELGKLFRDCGYRHAWNHAIVDNTWRF